MVKNTKISTATRLAIDFTSQNPALTNFKDRNFSKIQGKAVISKDISGGFLDIVADLGFGDKKIIFVSDEIIWKNSNKFFAKNFLEKINKNLILKNPKADQKNLDKILNLSRGFDLIIALGSGVINDLCKLSATNLQIPYIIIPSAASMNGYLSKNSSITINGHKKTLAATLPLALICDLRILAKAPSNLTRAGIGDAMCFYSCWFDWYLSHLIFKTKFDKKPFLILEKKMQFLLKNYQKFSLKDHDFLEILIEILLLSGIGMTIAGGSYPASQSEHLIAHIISMKYPQEMQNILHGNQIAVTVKDSISLQKKIISKNILQIKKCEFPKKELEKFFGKKIAAECEKEFILKTLNDEEINKINVSLKRNWKNYKKELEEIFVTWDKLRKIFDHFKIKTSRKIFGISEENYEESVGYAKFIRNRFTCLDSM